MTQHTDETPKGAAAPASGYAGPPVEFRATAWEFFGFSLLQTLLIAVTCGLYLPFVGSQVRQWVVRRTYVHGEQLIYKPKLRDLALTVIMNWGLMLLTLGIYAPWAMARMHRYYWRSTTVADGRTCRFEGTGGELLGILFGGLLLTVLTFGIGAPWAMAMFLRWSRGNVWIGGERMEFGGSGMQILGWWLAGYLLNAITCNLAGSWVFVSIQRWVGSSSELAFGEDTSEPPTDEIERKIIAAAAQPTTWYAVGAGALILSVGVAGLYLSGSGDSGADDVDLLEAYGDEHGEFEEALRNEELAAQEYANIDGEGAAPVAPSNRTGLPAPVARLASCLGSSRLAELSAATEDSVAACLQSQFGEKAERSGGCRSDPVRVYTANVLDPCTYQRRDLDSPSSPTAEVGIGKLNVLFYKGRFAGVTMVSTLPASGGRCAVDAAMTGFWERATAQGTAWGPGRHLDGMSVALTHHRSDGTLYGVQRATLALFVSRVTDGAVGAVPAFGADYTVARAELPPLASGSSRVLKTWLRDAARGAGCGGGSLTDVFGRSLDRMNCSELRNNKPWSRWPVQRAASRKPPIAVIAAGTPARVAEVYTRVSGAGSKLLGELEDDLGRSTRYDCSGHAWRTDEWVVRARSKGRRGLAVAVVPAAQHRDFSILVPEAHIGPRWR